MCNTNQSWEPLEKLRVVAVDSMGLSVDIFPDSNYEMTVIGRDFDENGNESFVEICTGEGREADERLGNLLLRGLILQEKDRIKELEL